MMPTKTDADRAIMAVFVSYACLYTRERNWFPFLIFYCPGEVEAKKCHIRLVGVCFCFLCRYLFLHPYSGLITDLPPIYGRRTSGIFTEPSSFKLFSRNAISIRGGATTVLLRVCAKYLPFSPTTRIFNLLACASPRLEQLPTSKYFF